MALERYFSRLQPRTQKVSRWIMNGLLDWLRVEGGAFRGFGADELVAWQRAHPGEYDLLDVIQDYVRRKEGRYMYKARVYGALKGFFAHNRCELPRDPGFRVVGTRPSVVGRLIVDEFRRVLAASNPLYRAVFLCMFQAGLGVEELLYFDGHGYASLLEQLERRETPIKVELPGRKKLKNVKPYYTFLGRDAVDALKVWLRERPANCPLGRIFCTQFLEPLSYKSIYQYWLRKLSDLGLVIRLGNSDPSNRYGKGPHEMRDLFRTRWRPSGVDIEAGEYFMGHDIDDLEYDKSPRDYPEWFKEKYLEAEPWLNVVSEDPERVPRVVMESTLRKMEEAQNAAQKEILARLEYLERKLMST